MEHARKMMIIPADSLKSRNMIGGGNAEEVSEAALVVDKAVLQPKKILLNAGDKILRSIKIALKLALINCYDDKGRLLNENGKIVENSDLGYLLNYAMTPGRVLNGEQEFIDALYKANVDPELLINDNVRSKLSSMLQRRVKSTGDATNAEVKVEIKKRSHSDDELSDAEERPSLPERKRSRETYPLPPLFNRNNDGTYRAIKSNQGTKRDREDDEKDEQVNKRQRPSNWITLEDGDN